MDATLFAKMLADKDIIDLKKLGYKYPKASMGEFVSLLQESFTKELPLRDFHGNTVVFLPGVAQVQLSAAKVLLTPQDSSQVYGKKAMEDEILSTFSIEQIDTSRDSVRKILAGYAPSNEMEHRVLGMKLGLEYIADTAHPITERNLFHLYQMVVGQFLPTEDRLLPGKYYRHDSVFVVGSQVEYTGLPWQKLPSYMAEFLDFIQGDALGNDLLQAAAIHFYLAYLHPYFDGNGRMARLLHLWFLVQRGYSSALFVPLSEYIQRTKNQYYKAFTLVEQNAALSGTVDITPFFVYFIQHVYGNLKSSLPAENSLEVFQKALAEGQVTEKEKALWQFVLSAYGTGEFSTKQLEKDFGNAAYATIRAFVMKFEQLGLLRSTSYGNRKKYRVAG